MLFRKRESDGGDAEEKLRQFTDSDTGRGAARQTLIGTHTRLKGTLKGQGAVVICGTLRGGIDLAGSLTVANGGRIEADIDVQTAQISGRARGTMRAATSVRVEATGVFEGDIATPVLDLRPGSILNGHASILGITRRPPAR